MSRYRWPRRNKSPDRPLQRLRWNIATNGAVLEESVHAARAARREAERARTEAPRAARRGLVPGAAPAGATDLWLPIGPSVVIKGQAGTNPRVAGRVRDLAVSDDGTRAYAATANGGVWFSGDAGASWSPLGNWMVTPGSATTRLASTALTCGCLLVTFGAASDGSGDNVYLGTGELRPDRQGTPGGQLGGVGVLHLRTPVPAAVASPFGNHWDREAPNLAGYGIYRLAKDPRDANTLVAATSIGLFSRSGPFVENADWDRVTLPPFDFEADDNKVTTDVVWTSSIPSRLFVALWSGSSGVYVSEFGLDGPFEKLDLPQLRDGRIALALSKSNEDRIYVLGAGTRLYRVTETTANRILDVPEMLFGKGDHDQSWYDMAIAVHPEDSSTIFIGGSTVYDAGEWSASLFRSSITSNADGDLTFGFNVANIDNPNNDPTYVGSGIHADVHQIRLVKVGADLHGWVTCDGGIFRSTNAATKGTYTPRNVGLAVLEGGYVASHPESEHFVVLGTQDNGALQRVGDSVWMHTGLLGGDAGGVAFHPQSGRYFAAQYTQASWDANDVHVVGTTITPRFFARPVLRGNNATSEAAENESSSFYSGIDVQPATGTAARVALGTYRVWESENWDPAGGAANTWKTLPSGVDPRRADPTDTGTDVLDSDFRRVTACRWADDHRLFALFERALVIFTPPATGTVWAHEVVTKVPSHCGSWENDDIDQPTSDYLPPLGAWSDLALDGAAPGSKTCYVACTGHAKLDGDTVTESPRMDTLWWYDGAGKWWPTGLRNDDTPQSRGTKAPAFAVLVDPDDRTVVFVGTALGVWRGQRTMSGSTPDWTWAVFSNGLPEAAVQDISLYRAPTGMKLLRAAIQARGVWEVDLSPVPTPPQQIFLRTHLTDARRRNSALLANPTLSDTATWPWYASPDIKVRRAADAPPWGASEPTEVDLLELAEPLSFAPTQTAVPAVTMAPAWVSPPSPMAPLAAIVAAHNVAYKVDVLVHYRDQTALDKNNVAVTLLRFALPPTVVEWEAVAIPDGLKTQLTDLLTVAVPAAWPPADPWQPADAGLHRRRLNFAIDARTPRVATFDVDLTAAANGLHLLLAVVSATTDPLSVAGLAGANLRDLVLQSRYVAARVVRVS